MPASFYDLRKFAKTGIASPDMTDFDKRRALYAFGKYSVKTITGVPPIIFRAQGSPLTDIIICGNMVQSGTPSSSSPVYPSETGDKTANLFSGTLEQGTVRGTDGAILNSSVRVRSAIKVQSGTYTVSSTQYLLIVAGYSGTTFTGTIYSAITDATKTTTFTVPSGTDTIRLVWKNASNNADTTNIVPSDVENIMLNSGSTALPYEPYGYRIPITRGTTQNIYLREPIRRIGDYVDSVGMSIGGANRKIRKLVLTGDEDGWRITATGKMAYLLSSESNKSIGCICSHYIGTNAQNISQLNDLECSTSVGTGELAIYDSNFTALGDFKTYLSNQYAAGTPVTVWYVLATPETETATIPQIQTTRGNNTLSIGTTLQPSYVTVTGHIK